MLTYKCMNVTLGVTEVATLRIFGEGSVTTNTAQAGVSDTSKIIPYNQDGSGCDVERLMDYASHPHCAAVCWPKKLRPVTLCFATD